MLLVLVLTASACNEFVDPPPLAPTVTPTPPSQFTIGGRWDGVTDQGRPLGFDVSADSAVNNGALTLHHDCTGGRLVLPLSGYGAAVSGDTFSATINWRRDEGTKFYVGTLTVSGRFESARLARGGFVNSITDKQADNLGVCGSVSGTWEVRR